MPTNKHTENQFDYKQNDLNRLDWAFLSFLSSIKEHVIKPQLQRLKNQCLDRRPDSQLQKNLLIAFTHPKIFSKLDNRNQQWIAKTLRHNIQVDSNEFALLLENNGHLLYNSYLYLVHDIFGQKCLNVYVPNCIWQRSEDILHLVESLKLPFVLDVSYLYDYATQELPLGHGMTPAYVSNEKGNTVKNINYLLGDLGVLHKNQDYYQGHLSAILALFEDSISDIDDKSSAFLLTSVLPEPWQHEDLDALNEVMTTFRDSSDFLTCLGKSRYNHFFTNIETNLTKHRAASDERISDEILHRQLRQLYGNLPDTTTVSPTILNILHTRNNKEVLRSTTFSRSVLVSYLNTLLPSSPLFNCSLLTDHLSDNQIYVNALNNYTQQLLTSRIMSFADSAQNDIYLNTYRNLIPLFSPDLSSIETELLEGRYLLRIINVEGNDENEIILGEFARRINSLLSGLESIVIERIISTVCGGSSAQISENIIEEQSLLNSMQSILHSLTHNVFNALDNKYSTICVLLKKKMVYHISKILACTKDTKRFHIPSSLYWLLSNICTNMTVFRDDCKKNASETFGYTVHSSSDLNDKIHTIIVHLCSDESTNYSFINACKMHGIKISEFRQSKRNHVEIEVKYNDGSLDLMAPIEFYEKYINLLLSQTESTEEIDRLDLKDPPTQVKISGKRKEFCDGLSNSLEISITNKSGEKYCCRWNQLGIGKVLGLFFDEESVVRKIQHTLKQIKVENNVDIIDDRFITDPDKSLKHVNDKIENTINNIYHEEYSTAQDAVRTNKLAFVHEIAGCLTDIERIIQKVDITGVYSDRRKIRRAMASIKYLNLLVSAFGSKKRKQSFLESINGSICINKAIQQLLHNAIPIGVKLFEKFRDVDDYDRVEKQMLEICISNYEFKGDDDKYGGQDIRQNLVFEAMILSCFSNVIQHALSFVVSEAKVEKIDSSNVMNTLLEGNLIKIIASKTKIIITNRISEDRYSTIQNQADSNKILEHQQIGSLAFINALLDDPDLAWSNRGSIITQPIIKKRECYFKTTFNFPNFNSEV